MRKSLLLLTLLILTASVSGFEYVNTTEEWENGQLLDSIQTTGDQIFLDSETPSLSWSQDNFDHRVSEIVQTDDYIYAVSGYDKSGKITKIHKSNGSFVWEVTNSSSDNKYTSLDIGEDGYLYAVESQDGIYRLDKSGNFQDGGIYPIDDDTPESGFATYEKQEYDAEYLDGHLYLTGHDGDVSKFDAETGDLEWNKDIDTFAREIDVYNSSNIYLGAAYDAYRLDPSDGSIKDNLSDINQSVDAIERGPDGDIWIGDNGGVKQYTPDLSTEICINTDYNEEVPGMATDFSGVFTSTKGDDRFNKLEGDCNNVVWQQSPVFDNKGYDTLEADGRALFAGSETINGTENGTVDKYYKEYDLKGNYESENFNWSGNTRYTGKIDVKTDLNGQEADLIFNWSEDMSLDPSNTSGREYPLDDGINSFYIDSEKMKAAKFKVQLRSISNTDTPIIEWVNFSAASDEGSVSVLECNEFGLIGCWKMEAGSGQIVYDYSDRNNDGSMGYSFSPDEDDPIWENDTSKCISGGCINFFEGSHSKPGGNQVTIPDSNNLTFGEFSLTGAIKLDSADGSPGTIIHKENEIMVVADYPTGNIAASIYNSTECGGWCGADDVKLGGDRFYYSDMQANYNEWFSFKVTWNGTHFSFYNKTGLVDTGSPANVTGYTTPEDNSADLLIGAEGRTQGSHLEGPMDEIKLYNSSDLGFVPGTSICNSAQEGAYSNIEESTEDTGRLKNDREICLQNPSDNFEFYDQDYGDINGDGVQETCRQNSLYGQRGVRWISESMVENHPHAFTGGIDDDVTPLTSENYESRPDQDNWLNDQTPVPTGTSETYTSTLGFCGGDDEGEYLITQECNTGLCSSDNSVIGVAKTPQSCVLNGGDYNLENSENRERKIYSQGENVTFDLGSESQSVACYDGTWYDKWPVSAGPTGTMEIGQGQTSSYDFKVINIQDVRKEFRVELQGDEEAKRFTDFDGRNEDSFEISVPPKSSKNIRVNVFGGNSDVDDANVRVQATALTGDISGEDSFKINILDRNLGNSTVPQTQNVPGIGFIHLIVILLISVMGRYFIIDQ